MSHDLPPTPTAPSHDARAHDGHALSPARSRSSSPQRRKKSSKKKRNPGLAKKLGFITHLLKTLDLVVFAELSALYYMEYTHRRPPPPAARRLSLTCRQGVPCSDSSCAPPASTCI